MYRIDVAFCAFKPPQWILGHKANAGRNARGFLVTTVAPLNRSTCWADGLEKKTPMDDCILCSCARYFVGAFLEK